MKGRAPREIQDCRVLVTGGAGFIGSHLVELLVQRGADVTVLDDLSTGRLSHLKSISDCVEIVELDLSRALTEQAVPICDFQYVFHLAGNSSIPPSISEPERDYRSTLYSGFLLLEAIRKASRRPFLVNISSSAVYGSGTLRPLSEGDACLPLSPYGVSRLAVERYAAVYSEVYEMEAVSLRLFPVYGPRQRKLVVFDLMRKLSDNPAHLEVLGDGSQQRAFTYVGDVALAILAAAERCRGAGEAVNIASPVSYSLRELVDALIKVSGQEPQVAYSGKMRPGDADRLLPDLSAMGELGIECTTGLHQGLKLTWEWFLAERRGEAQADPLPWARTVS